METLLLTPSKSFGLGLSFGRLARSFAENFRRIQAARRLTGRAIALASGIVESQISDYRTGKGGQPELPTLLKLARAMHCSVEELVEGIDEDYDRVRRELIRHGGDPQSELPPDVGGSNASTQAGLELQQLRTRLAQYEEAAGKVLSVTDELFDAAVALEEMRQARDREPRRGRRHRKTG